MIWFRRGVIATFILSVIGFAASLMLWMEDYDVDAPVITMEEEEIIVSIEDAEYSWLEGIHATDALDGDVTSSLMVEHASGFTTEMQREVSILAFDTSNNITKITRMITYSDYTEPTFQLSGALRIAEGNDISQLLKFISAEDCREGDISEWVQQYYVGDSVIDTEVVGYYPMTFSVFNSLGDSVEFQATIEVYDATQETVRPTIKLNEYMIYLENGAEFNPVDYLDKIVYEEVQYISFSEEVVTEEVELEENEEESLVAFDVNLLNIINEVNTDVSGWYEVSYSLSDIYGNQQVVYLLVCVEER